MPFLGFCTYRIYYVPTSEDTLSKDLFSLDMDEISDIRDQCIPRSTHNDDAANEEAVTDRANRFTDGTLSKKEV